MVVRRKQLAANALRMWNAHLRGRCSFITILIDMHSYKNSTQKTKTLTVQRQGDVKVVNVLASIHKILEEIAPSGMINCQMMTGSTQAKFIFKSNGVEAIFQIRKGGAR